MRNYFFILIGSISIAPLFSLAQSQPNIDVLHYRFALSLEDSTDVIDGNTMIRFNNLVPVNAINLDLANKKSGKGMQVQSVFVNAQPAKYDHRNDKLQIIFPNTLQPGTTTEITIQYTGIPADGLVISKNKYGKRTFFGDNWPNRARNWLPCVDDPADKASVEFIVTAPQHYRVVSNGIQVEESNLKNNRKLTHWKEDVPLPTKVMVIGVADFAVQLAGTVDCIPVSSWVFPEDREKGFYDYALATEILSYFIQNVGPYGYKKLANVQSKTIFGGMENAGAIFYSENIISGKRTSESLLAHEIAHQWFGNMATEKNFAHLWLSEGFATYMTILYMESKYGTDTLQYMIKEDRQQIIEFSKKNNQPVVDTSVTDYMKLLNANSYQKGSWVLHMLRKKLGDSVFQKSIRRYYSAYAGKNAATNDLRKVFESISGKNLEPFFKQWLYTAGQPNLDVKWKYQPKEKSISIAIVQKQNNVFEFPLEIQLKFPAGKNLFISFQITRQKEVFTIQVDEKPVSILLDPYTSLLFKGTVKQE